MPKSTSGASGASASPAASEGNPRKRLGYMEQREYDGMEASILQAETVMHAAEAKVALPSVSSDHVALAKACRALEDAQAKVAALYARWAELDARKG